ncbi:MAG TPA: alpha/beta fold hydrolase [Bacteroidales bacterium]|nr:alpha/beta fold hydrolase [Bacteroidales bacterium]HRZ49582.1 alpha/beta fold hydrolase [Bacteroidales bacterium]
MKAQKLFLLVAAVLFICHIAHAQPLPRKSWFNVIVRELNDSLKTATKATEGLFVVSVGEKGTAEALGILPGDVLLTLNGQPVKTKEDLKPIMTPLREGDPVGCEVWRKKKVKALKGFAAPVAGENPEGYLVEYERAPFEGGNLSVIITRPEGEGPFPVILFIPGYMCYSLDNIGTHPYGRIAELLTRQGYMVVRVEKSGEGASMGTPDCRSIGLYKEVEGFRAGLRKIYTLPKADTSNVFIFGHSLGAMQAPMVAKGFNVKGIIIEGTSGDSWFEYILAMFRFQNPIMGMDPAENEDMIAKATPLLYNYLVQKDDPAELAKVPAWDSILMEMMQYDHNGHIWDRHYTYWQELQDVNQPAAWRDCSAHVLVLRGSGDLEAFSTEQHEGIVRTINHYRPGTATFVLLPNSDHAFCKSDTPEESYKNGQVKGYHREQFNENVIGVVKEWIDQRL